MAMDPFFSLTPQAPFVYSYDAAAPAAPYAMASLASYGGLSWSFDPYRLQDQVANDELIVGRDAVPLEHRTMASFTNDLYRRCGFSVGWYGYNIPPDGQFLVVVQLRGIRDATAQFFVGTEFVRAEAIAGDAHVALLIDVPQPVETTGSLVITQVSMGIRLASSWPDARLGFRGVVCYLM